MGQDVVCARLLEDDGTAAVDQDADFKVPADGAGLDPPHLAAERYQIFDRVAVGDVLVDYGPCVGPCSQGRR